MRFRGPWRLLRSVLHILHGVFVAVVLFPRMNLADRHVRIRWWAAKLLRLLGIELRLQGSFRPGAKLIVANHISWLDIMAVHAFCPEARFVSKADVKAWPMVGRLVTAAGTLYIERERRRDALRVVHQMAEALNAGETVAVFPEGTTGAGHTLLPFHANLLQAAIATSTPVQPVALRFSEPHFAVSPTAQYIGDTTLMQSLWRVACGQGLVAHVQVLPAEATAHADRRALTEHLRQRIAEVLE